jgi:hypothetical protein
LLLPFYFWYMHGLDWGWLGASWQINYWASAAAWLLGCISTIAVPTRLPYALLTLIDSGLLSHVLAPHAPLQACPSLCLPPLLQMSRFRTDHLVLPDTAAAVASSLTAVPDGAQDFLLPPSVATAIKEAEAKQQLQFMQGSGGGGAMAAEQPAAQPQDAAGAADAFLSSLSDMLGGGGGGSGGPAATGDGGVAPPLPPGLPPPLDPLQQQQQEEEAAAREEEEAEEAAAERPVDLFKAIFEDSEEEEEEEEEVR